MTLPTRCNVFRKICAELNRRDDGQSQDDRLGIGNGGHGGRLRTSTAESLRNAAPHTEGGLSASFSQSGSAGGRDLTEEEDTFQRRHQLSTWSVAHQCFSSKCRCIASLCLKGRSGLDLMLDPCVSCMMMRTMLLSR